MNLRHAAIAALVLVVLVTPLRAQSTSAFYTTLFERGLANAKVGNWKAAAQELRIAAFGLVDDLPRYQTAHIYGAIASEKLGQSEEARIAAEKVVTAERLSRSYTALPLDPATRSSFEALLSKYVTAERLKTAPAFANITSTRPSTPRPNTTFTSTTPAAPPTPALPPYAEGNDIALRARSSWIAGDLVNAVKLATEAINLDFASGPAREVLGNIAAIERRWTDVVEHFTIARTTQRLTEDEKNKLATGFANVGRAADAAALRKTMPVAAPPAVAVQPQPQPAPVTRATPPPTPAPQPQPQPRVLAPQPQPQTIVAPKPAPPRPTNQPRTPPPTPVEPADGMASTIRPRTPAATTTARTVAPQPASSGTAGVVRSASTGGSGSSSPLVSASRHSPSEAILASDPVLMLADADRLLAEGKIIAARELFARVAHLQTLNRNTLLGAARGLNQTSAFRDSSASYQRAYPLEPGEEAHMFHEAVNRFELGDYPFAKELLRRALPKLPPSRELSAYKSKIEAAP